MIDSNNYDLELAGKEAAAKDYVLERTNIIYSHTKLSDSVEAVENAMSKYDLDIYRMENRLIEVRPTTITYKVKQLMPDGKASIVKKEYTAIGTVDIKAALLTILLSKYINFQKFDVEKDKIVDIAVPPQLPALLLARDAWWVRKRLTGVLSCPTLRPDGSLLASPGYDEDTGYFLSTDVKFSYLNEHVSPPRAFAENALRQLRYLLKEMPFVDNEEDRSTRGYDKTKDGLAIDMTLSESAAMSMLLSGVARAAFPSSPLHGTNGPEFGSSKTFLQLLAGILATGQEPPVFTWADKDEENTKMLTAAILAGYPIMILDNVNGLLTNILLSQIITQPRLDLRILGESRMVPTTHSTSVMANGVNITPSEDLGRRSLMTNLDPKMENPHERTFTQDPRQMLLANRTSYLEMALVILRSYVTHGWPDAPPSLNGFTEWSDLVRGALMWLGCPDPVLTQKRVLKNDPRKQAYRALVAALKDIAPNNQPLTAAELIEKARAENGKPLYDALVEFCGSVGELNSIRLGNKLASKRGSITEGYVLRDQLDGHSKIKRWFVEVQ